MQNANIKSHIEIERFRSLAETVEEIVKQKDQLDVDTSNAPEEFRGTLSEVLSPKPKL